MKFILLTIILGGLFAGNSRPIADFIGDESRIYFSNGYGETIGYLQSDKNMSALRPPLRTKYDRLLPTYEIQVIEVLENMLGSMRHYHKAGERDFLIQSLNRFIELTEGLLKQDRHIPMKRLRYESILNSASSVIKLYGGRDGYVERQFLSIAHHLRMLKEIVRKKENICSQNGTIDWVIQKPNRKKIEKRAYHIWEKEGGKAEENWHKAKEELMREGIKAKVRVFEVRDDL